MKISHLISSLEEAQTGPNYDSLAGGSQKIRDYNAAKNAAPVTQPGTALATTNNNPDLEKLEKAKQAALAKNPQLAKDVQASDASVQNSQQRANDVSTYQQKQASEKNMGQADVVDVDAKDVKDVSNQPQLEKPAVAPAQDAGAGAFDNIVNQTTNSTPDTPQTSSSGGTTTNTGNDVTHTSNPNNPNQPPATTAAAPAQQKQTFGGALKQLGGKVVKGATNAVGNAIKAAPGAIAGTVGDIGGSFVGGAKGGYNKAYNRAGGGSMGGGAGGGDIQSLNARLANIEKRLGVTAEGKLQFESKFLGKKI